RHRTLPTSTHFPYTTLFRSGLTLMGAAFDPRIKAVASLSGWADLADSLYSGQTRHLQAAALLTAIETPTGRKSPEFARMLADLLDRKSTRLNSSHSQISYAV